jgi:acetyl-CoA carboxylase carboxyl transferase subunit beta
LLEDLFKTVRSRFDVDLTSDRKNKVSIPADLLFKCPRCGNVMFMEDFNGANKVCSACNYHARLTARERLKITVDKDSFVEYDKDMTSKNPIGFVDYEEKIQKLQQKTGLKDSVITGECTIKTKPCVVVVMDSTFMMASMGSVAGEKIARAFERAEEKKLPVIVFAASGGARMQEGILSLMQMAKTSAAVKRHSDAGLLYITVMTDPTTGGVTASFASLGDIILAEPKVLIGFAGRRVIEGTIKQRLPDDFQSAEFLLEHGFVDMIVDRKNMRRTLSKLLRHHGYPGSTPDL